MSIKKKLGMGVVTAALGLSLIGGGTFAYFNDTATIHNAFASGTLDIKINQASNHSGYPVNFDIQNMRPGDIYKRLFALQNIGSLAIGDVFLTMEDSPQANDEFLKALIVRYWIEAKSGGTNSERLIGTVSMYDLLRNDLNGKVDSDYLKVDPSDNKLKINLTPASLASGNAGLDVGEQRFYRIEIEFKDTNVPQNDLQGQTAFINFHLDARQEIGTKSLEKWTPNGYNDGNEKFGSDPSQLLNSSRKLLPSEQTDN